MHSPRLAFCAEGSHAEQHATSSHGRPDSRKRFIDDLLNRTDIVEVVSSRIQLKKTGKNYSARCPFHNEKTPSFSVSPDKQFYYCFGCGAGGNALGFVMDHDHLEFPQAVEELAKRAGIEVPREEGGRGHKPRQPTDSPLYPLLDAAAQLLPPGAEEPSGAPGGGGLSEEAAACPG